MNPVPALVTTDSVLSKAKQLLACHPSRVSFYTYTLVYVSIFEHFPCVWPWRYNKELRDCGHQSFMPTQYTSLLY